MRRNVRVCMGRWIMLERNRGAVDMNGMFVAENLSGNRAGWRLWKGVAPVVHARRRGKVLARVFVRKNRRALRVQPLVPARVIEVPVSVDELPDRIRADRSQCRADLGP